MKSFSGRVTFFKRRTVRSETIFGNWNPFKNDEKCFYFVLKILSFSLEILVMYWNGLIKNIRFKLISNFMTSQLGQQTILIHILPNIWRSKDNQTMKFSQLIERNMTNISLEKSYSKCGGETSHRLFSEKWKLSISLDQQSNIL